MSTSANVTEYEITDLQGNQVGNHREHALCKSQHQELIDKFSPTENFEIRAYWYDEDEAYHEGNAINLKDWLIINRRIPQPEGWKDPRFSWVPYTGNYEKQGYDVRKKDGTEWGPCWPNAGNFWPLFDGYQGKIPGGEIDAIRPTQNPLD